MFQKIQSCCMRCFDCSKIKIENNEDYDYKKNEDITLENKKEFEKLLEEIVIIRKNNEAQVKKLVVSDLNLDSKVNENIDCEDEIEYVLC